MRPPKRGKGGWTAVAGACAGLFAVDPAAALVVASEDRELHERAPAEIPGWDHVGRLGGVSAIYLGGGWILTARHAGFADVEIGGTLYPAVPGSLVALDAPGRAGEKSDLALFRIDPAPALPPLALPSVPPTRGSLLALVGFGRGRGEPYAGPAGTGFHLDAAPRKRWGTNRVSQVRLELVGPGRERTRAFAMDFSRHGTEHEAQAITGDSGGAVFLKQGETWTLGGVLISVALDTDQESGLALFGNRTHAADLHAYASQIQRILGRRP
jgi:hypothetical protein